MLYIHDFFEVRRTDLNFNNVIVAWLCLACIHVNQTTAGLGIVHLLQKTKVMCNVWYNVKYLITHCRHVYFRDKDLQKPSVVGL